MTTDTQAKRLVELAERCEAATGPNDRLDAEIEAAIQRAQYPDAKAVKMGRTWSAAAFAAEPARGLRGWRRYGMFFQRHRFTASLDAAMTLVPEGYILSALNQRTLYELTEAKGSGDPDESALWMAYVHIQTNDRTYRIGERFRAYGHAATPALALCGAALRTRAQSPGESRD